MSEKNQQQQKQVEKRKEDANENHSKSSPSQHDLVENSQNVSSSSPLQMKPNNSSTVSNMQSSARDKVSTQQKMRVVGGVADPSALFPDIAQVKQPERASMATQSSQQRNSTQIDQQPSTANMYQNVDEMVDDFERMNPTQEPIMTSSIQASPVVEVQTKRQLSNFNAKQRLSQSQVSNQPKSNASQMNDLINQQNYQHQAYISRQTYAQQVLTQSIGEASNGSYVFDGGNNAPNRGVELQVRSGLGGGGGIGNASHNIQVETRSLSNESSPSSKFQRRNLMYRNVRNYNNLYENRSLASKNIEMQDQLRLGCGQKLWTFKRTNQFLPQIQTSQGVSSSNYQSQISQMAGPNDLESEMKTTSNMTQMKQIKRSMMDDGTHQPKLELRHSPISSTLMEKPGTHHGYQSTHYTGNMAHTDPIGKQNMTSNSFNNRDDHSNWKPNTMNTPFMPELSVTSNFHMEGQINFLKPILRRNCLHNRNNIVIQWKSFEIWVVKLEYSGSTETQSPKLIGHKILNPVYAPLSELNHFLTLTPSQIELRVVKSLKLGPNGKQFIYVPLDIPTAGGVGVSTDQASDCQSPKNPSRKQSLSSPAAASKAQPNSPTVNCLWSDQSPTHQSGLSNSFKQQTKLSDQFEQSLGGTQSSATNLLPLDDKMPEEIQTSLFMQQASSEFTIIIRSPCIEYAIPSKNFLFMKTLTREENQEFIQSRFADWQALAIQCLTRYNKFKELLAIVERGQDYKTHLARIQAQGYRRPEEPSALGFGISMGSGFSGGGKTQKLSPVRKLPVAQQVAIRRDKAASATQMSVYLLEETTGKILDYSSLNDFKRQRFLAPKGGQLQGCFSQNNSLGQISVKPFAVVIKGLDTEYEYRHQFAIQHWKHVIGFMQYKCMKKPDDPRQLVDKLCKHFLRSLARSKSKNSTKIVFKVTSVLKSKKQDPSISTASYPLYNKEEKINERVNEMAQMISEPSKTMQKLTDLRNNASIGTSDEQLETQKQQIPQQQSKDSIEQQRKRFIQDSKKALRSFLSLQKRSKMLAVSQSNRYMGCTNNAVENAEKEAARYLVEIELPICQVIYQGSTYSKPLTEEDLVHLVSSSFSRWKNYLMTKHFRLELNIGQEKPLPRIVEDKRGEDDLISETDPRDKFPITEAEKPKIEQTRAQVTNWFPV